MGIGAAMLLLLVGGIVGEAKMLTEELEGYAVKLPTAEARGISR